MVWGDSFAMHLIPGLIETSTIGVIQATKVMCGPFYQIAPVRPSTVHNVEWAKKCINFTESVVKTASSMNELKVVVLSSPIDQYLPASLDRKLPSQHLLRKIGNSYVEYDSSENQLIDALRRTIELLHKAGKKVVIVAPPPSSALDMARCIDRKIAGLPVFGKGLDCNISVSDYHRVQQDVLHFLDRAKSELNVNVIYFDEILCNESICKTKLNGKYVYQDAGHLSIDGSVELGMQMNLKNKILEMAN
jgi:hypothetical protein